MTGDNLQDVSSRNFERHYAVRTEKTMIGSFLCLLPQSHALTRGAPIDHHSRGGWLDIVTASTIESRSRNQCTGSAVELRVGDEPRGGAEA
jgi:hypothetical protein